MPRTIFQRNERTYIGDRIVQALARGTYGPISRLIPTYTRLPDQYPTYRAMAGNSLDAESWSETLPVHDREVNSWVRLNVGKLMVDYAIRNLKHDRATIVWQQNWDFQKIWVMVNTAGEPEQKISRDPKAGSVVLVLKEDTEYEVNVLAEVPWGLSESNRQTFRTPINPIPDAPTNLRYTARTNTSITLSWDASRNSMTYAVYRAVEHGGLQKVATVSDTTATISLSQDTRYRFSVLGINGDGLGGPHSNEIRSATGHDTIRRQGHVDRLCLPPLRWGSWRSDIGWNWWYTYPEKDANVAIYQGYWQYPHRRYWGVIEYDPGYLQQIVDSRFGASTARNLRVTEASVRRIYRQRMAGNVTPLEMVWHLTNTKAHAHNAQPTTYGQHVNTHDSADSLAWQRSIGAGKVIEFLRIPRAWGEAILQGRSGGNEVRGLALNRMDAQNNGYGYAGYMKISGHGQPDYHLGSQGWRYSDLSLVISANWDYLVSSYKAPSDW